MTAYLSEAGCLAARTGEVRDLYSVFDEINYVTPECFEFSLDWQLKLRQRHKEIRFGVVVLDLVGLPQVIDTLGYTRGMALIDAVAGRIKAMVRDTDLLTRTAEDRIWLLLPQSSTHGLKFLTWRLSQLLGEGLDEALNSLGTVHYACSSGMSEAEDAAAVMARLGSGSQ